MAGVSSAFGNVTVRDASGNVIFSNVAGQSYWAGGGSPVQVSPQSLPATTRGTTYNVSSTAGNVPSSFEQELVGAAVVPALLAVAGGGLATAATSSAVAATAGTVAVKAGLLKTVAETGLAAIGTATFGNFIYEEALQAASFGVSTAIQAKDAEAARAALDKYKRLIVASKTFLDTAGQAGLVTEPAFRAFNEASAASVPNYELRIAALEAALDKAKWKETAKAIKDADTNTLARARLLLQLGNRALAQGMIASLRDEKTAQTGALALERYDATQTVKSQQAKARADAAAASAGKKQAAAEEKARKEAERQAQMAAKKAEREARRLAQEAAKAQARQEREAARATKAQLAAEAKARKDYEKQVAAAKKEAQKQAQYAAQLEAERLRAQARLLTRGF
jgi:hypothetical protein